MVLSGTVSASVVDKTLTITTNSPANNAGDVTLSTFGNGGGANQYVATVTVNAGLATTPRPNWTAS